MERAQTQGVEYDVLVIGAGPGGLSAATAAKNLHNFRVAVLERDEVPGGILNQCVHDGFGIVRYGAQLSGPEYAQIEWEKALDAGVEILTGRMVTEIQREAQPPAPFRVTVLSRHGREVLRAKSIVLATGCRERTRGMLSIPGTRPAGIYTAGVAQNLINRKNLMVGRRVVILGSGDIGLIMARRLTLEGATVLCVAEVMKEPSGLARNVRQCLFDYGIPLYLSTTVSNIYGKGRLESVELSRVDEHLRPYRKTGCTIQWPPERNDDGTGKDEGAQRSENIGELTPGNTLQIECDTLILSVGLIPENEVAQTAGVALDPKTNGVITDEYLQTSVPGIFACGNARAVMDLADFVSDQGETAGRNAAAYARNQMAVAEGIAAPDRPDRTTPAGTAAPDRSDRTVSAGAAAMESIGRPVQPLQKWEKDLHNVARKGLPEEGSVTCTLCPKGCQVWLAPATGSKVNKVWLAPATGGEVNKVWLAPATGGEDNEARSTPSEGGSQGDDQVAKDADQLIAIGNACPRGEAFARQELTDPHRILTTTMLVQRRSGEDGTRRDAAEAAPYRAQQDTVSRVQAPAARETDRSGSVLLPVRSDRPVPLHEMRALAKQLRSRTLTIPPEGIRRGDVLVHGLGTEQVNIIAETSMD